MAYFSNSNEGMCFAEQCDRCRYGLKPCPIANIQMEFNYKAANDKQGTEILNSLVKNNGTCAMFEAFKKDFELSEGEKAQMEMF